MPKKKKRPTKHSQGLIRLHNRRLQNQRLRLAFTTFRPLIMVTAVSCGLLFLPHFIPNAPHEHVLGVDTVLNINSQNPSSPKMPQIKSAAHDYIKTSGLTSIAAVGRYFVSLGLFSSVTAHASANAILTIDVIERRPVAIMMGDKPRLLSENGEVYGSAASDLAASDAHLPVVKHLFEHRMTPFQLTENGSLVLLAGEKNLVQQTRDLIELTMRLGMPARVLDYDKFRGFTIQLDKHPLEVVLGFNSYDKKLTRLSTLLERAGRGEFKGLVRIELDYDGKAILKYDRG